jgi:hypothetical protein
LLVAMVFQFSHFLCIHHSSQGHSAVCILRSD